MAARTHALPGSPLHRAAALASWVLHPAPVLAGTVAALSAHARPGVAGVLLDVLVLVAGLVPGFALIALRVRQGRLSHPHVLLVSERRVVLPVLLVGLGVALAGHAALGAPAAVTGAMLAGVLAATGATLVNFAWKLSLHAAVSMGCAVLLWPALPAAAVATAAAALLVGAARVVVAHHTPAQVLAGWAYGATAMAGAARLVGGAGW